MKLGDTMQIVIAGLAKTGTTGLFHKLKNSLQEPARVTSGSAMVEQGHHMIHHLCDKGVCHSQTLEALGSMHHCSWERAADA